MSACTPGVVLDQDASVQGTFMYEGCKLSYRRWGKTCARPVVLLHGFMQSAESWDAVASSLKDDFCVYALDFIGHGASEKTKNPARYAYEDMALSVDRLIRQVCLPAWRERIEQDADGSALEMQCSEQEEQRTQELSTFEGQTERSEQRAPIPLSCNDLANLRVHVIGYSMGGRIALHLLYTSTDVIQSMVLEGCNLGCADEEAFKEADTRNRSWVERLRTDGMEKFVQYWEELPMFATQKELGLDVSAHAARAANDAESMALCLEGAGKQAMPPTAEILCSIKRAVGDCDPLFILYIYGSKDPKSAAVAQKLKELGVQIQTINAGHNVHLEALMLYLEKIRKFLSCDAGYQL